MNSLLHFIKNNIINLNSPSFATQLVHTQIETENVKTQNFILY